MPGLRISASVPRWLSAGIFALVLLVGLVSPLSADTGTYRISSYIVTLEPQNSGQVKITVQQQWQVLSGDIPWVTVGLPNDHFSIVSYSGAASKVSAANASGFSGVRVDLDRDYQPGQAFRVQFSVLQDNLLERLTADKKWRIAYTPGWYDRATIDSLQINLVSPVDYQTYSLLNPQPGSVQGNTFTWSAANLQAGARFALTVESLDGAFLSSSVPVGGASKSPFNTTFFVIVGVILVLALLVFLAVRRSRQAQEEAVKRRVAAVEEEMARDKQKKTQVEEGFEKYVENKDIEADAQGRYYDKSYGNYITPAIWAAVIANQANKSTNPRPPSSCACACVSCACACACACAGGGAAGCSRKTLHDCARCSGKRL